MIRYINNEDVYYSLDDVTKWLKRQNLLTSTEAHFFTTRCRAHVISKLADAYNQQCIYQHLEPIVLPLNDYFIHWIVWAKLLILLPETVRTHRKVEQISLLLDNPETVYVRSSLRGNINLVRIDVNNLFYTANSTGAYA
ncbi:hypothetical protein [Spirosoma rigui]|uniref:hypothetical protein n=1 Tax=Spirosoma rigui TaxID=564064 RepID=UPI0009B0CD3E|nr:hypothetical protein [Spirosoma rigui]